MTLLPKKSAEYDFRAAFERLKLDEPKALPKGTPVTQNNIAREAGCDPSALRKSRYPALVAEIQNYVASNTGCRPESERQKLLKQRQRSRDAKDTIADLKKQRDFSAFLLTEANVQIAILTRRLADITARYDELQGRTGPISITSSRSKSRLRPVDMDTQKPPKK